MIEIGNGIVVNCPGCDKEYNVDEYKELKKAKPKPIMSVHGKAAPREALAEIAKRIGDILHDEHVDIILHDEHVDVFNNNIYDPRICSGCGTEFGFVKIVGKDKDNTIYQIDLDLIEPKGGL